METKFQGGTSCTYTNFEKDDKWTTTIKVLRHTLLWTSKKNFTIKNCDKTFLKNILRFKKAKTTKLLLNYMDNLRSARFYV